MNTPPAAPPIFGDVAPSPPQAPPAAAPGKQPPGIPAVEMIDQAGNSLTVPLTQARQAYQSGQLGFVPDQTVPVRLGDGRLGTVDTKDLEGVFNGGGELAHPDEVNADRLKRWAETGHGQAVAAGYGYLRGILPFGIGDEIAKAAFAHGLDPNTFSAEDYLKAAEEEHPLLHGIGQAGGLIGGSLAGGSIFEAAGGAVEGAARGVLGEAAPSLLGRAAQSSVTLGARTAAEGALFGADEAIHESQLGDPDMTAEKLWAYAGRGMLFGGITGAALGPIGKVVGAAGKGVAKRVLGGATVGEAAEEQAWRALNPSKSAALDAERIPDGPKGVGRVLLDENLVKAGDNVEAVAPRVAARRTEVGEAIDKHLADLDALRGTEEGVSLDKVVGRIEKEVLSPLESRPFYESVTARVRKEVESLQAAAFEQGGDKAILSFKTWADWRRGLDDLIYRTAGDPTPITKELRSMRGVIESEIESAGDQIAKQAGTQWADQYKATKLLYRRLVVADEAAQNALAANQANRVFSPTDYLATMGGMHLGHGPFGIMEGLAMGAIHHAVRTRGNATVAALLDKLSTLGAVKRMSSGVEDYVESRIARTITRGGVREAKEEEARIAENARAELKAKYEANVKALDEVSAHPELLKERTKRLLGPVEGDAPATVAAYTLAAQRAVKYMQSKRPSTGPTYVGLPPYPKPELSDTKMASFNRTVEGATEPLRVLHEMPEKGLAPEHVDAMKSIMPNFHKQIVGSMVAAMADSKRPPSYQSRIALGRLAGVPGHESLTPAAIQASQLIYQQKNKPTPKPPRQQLKLGDKMQTQTERAMGK